MNVFLRWLLGMGGAVACAVCMMLLVPVTASAQCANGSCRASSYGGGYGGGSYGGGYGSGFSVGMSFNSGWSQPSYATPQYYSPQNSQPAYYAPPIYQSPPAYYSTRSYSTPYRSKSVTRVYGNPYGQSYGRSADGGRCQCGSPGCRCGR